MSERIADPGQPNHGEAVLEIRMQNPMIDCSICGEPDAHRWGVPTYNGDVVSNDFPAEMWASGGGGQCVCRSCYEKHERGEIETFDRYYVLAADREPAGTGRKKDAEVSR